MLVLAASEARRTRPDQAAQLAITVLDIIPPDELRETTRHRLACLDNTLTAIHQPGPAARDLHERLRALSPPIIPATR